MQGCKRTQRRNNCHIRKNLIILTLCKIFLTPKHNFLSTSLHYPFSDFTVCRDYLFHKMRMLHGREFSSFQCKCVFFKIRRLSYREHNIYQKKKKRGVCTVKQHKMTKHKQSQYNPLVAKSSDCPKFPL